MELRRPHRSDDFEGVLTLVQACDHAVYGDSDWTAPELREEWDRLDLEHDAWVAVDDGRLAGVMHVYDERGGRLVADGYVHPELTVAVSATRCSRPRKGRAGELAAAVSPDTAITIETAHLAGDPRAPRLLACRGYAYARTFHRMVVDLADELPAPALPPRMELRPFDPDREGRRVKEALDEAFVDEWGFELRTYERWAERVLGVEQFDPSLFLVVWEGDEIAAASLNHRKQMGDWGWIGTLGVRPGWRRRGLGLALLQEGFRRFAERGETVAALGVDSDNPTGATRLYERAGMRVLWRADVWRKELRTPTAVAIGPD